MLTRISSAFLIGAVSILVVGVGFQSASAQTPPTISNVQFGTITSNSAVIIWDTNIMSDGKVGYLSMPIVRGDTRPPTFSSARCMTNIYAQFDYRHCIELTGLSPATIYGLTIESRVQNMEMVGISEMGENIVATLPAIPAPPQPMPPPPPPIVPQPPPPPLPILTPPPKIPLEEALGTVIEVTNKVEGAKVVSGTVTYSDGSPAIDQYVGAYQTSSGKHAMSPIDSLGNYSLTLPGGAWKIGVFPALDNGQSSRVAPMSIQFSSDSTAETRTVPFVLPLPGAAFTVTATNDSGSPIANAAVTLDSISASNSVSSDMRIVKAQSTGADGVATFILPPGRYYVRGNPPSSIYVSPPEITVNVSGSAAQSMQLVFHKAASGGTADMLSGTTHFDDSTVAPDTFIYAWSEEGASINTRSDSGGSFSLPLPKSSHWRIGARKMHDGKPYSSSELEVTQGFYGQSVDMVLVKKTQAIRNVVVVIPQSDGGGQAVNVGSNSMTGDVPTAPLMSNFISPQSGSLRLSIAPTVEVPAQAATQIIGFAYDVTLKDSSGRKITSFDKKIEIDLPYEVSDLRAEGATEASIRPSYFDEKSGTWIPIDDFFVDTSRHVVVLHVAHLTRFAIVSPADISPPMPPQNVAAAVVGSSVKLSWRNPAGDFDHAKVYRSTALGKLGAVLASEVRNATYADSSTAKGSKYFYTVRSIDLAGNESENTNQVTVDGVGSGSSTTKGGLTKTLSLGMSGKEVTLLQTILNKLGYLSAAPTGYFGAKTKQAVVAFQNANAKELLAPAGLKKGSGVVGALTRAKLNALNAN